jgi:uncharacterized membrane protein YphA (DoxX/SURF4 family)
MNKLSKDVEMKLVLAIGMILGFVSICFVFLMVTTGRLNVGDKWFEWKDDLVLVLGLIVIILMIGSFVSFMLSGIEAYSLQDKLTIKELEIELAKLKRT